MRLHCGIIILVCISGVISADEDLNLSFEQISPNNGTNGTTVGPETTTKLTPTTKPTTPPVTPTTSVAPPTSTEKPNEVGNWSVTDGGDKVCIMAMMEVQFVFKNSTLNHFLSPHATTEGSSCGNETQILVLNDNSYKIELIFVKNSGNVLVNNASVWYPEAEGEQHLNKSGEFFKVTEAKSFKCNSKEEIPFEHVTLEFSQLQVQAFVTEGKFDKAEKCDADIVLNDIIPIAVACVLAAMVIIILISYLVFRRQSRQRGYESV